MTKAVSRLRSAEKARGQILFNRADKLFDEGKPKAAFRLLLAAVDSGHKSAQLNLGYCYDIGEGVRRSRHLAMYWYKRAYRRGDSLAANNIGTIWRDEGNQQRALSWFRRAVTLGEIGANLEIAKVYLRSNDPILAIPYLEEVLRQPDRVTECDTEQAEKLLKRIRKGGFGRP